MSFSVNFGVNFVFNTYTFLNLAWIFRLCARRPAARRASACSVDVHPDHDNRPLAAARTLSGARARTHRARAVVLLERYPNV